MDSLQAKLIDEYGELDRQVREFSPVAARHEALKKIIKTWFNEMDPEETTVVEGQDYVIQVGACEQERKWIKLSKVYKACGSLTRFLSVCTVAFGALEGLLGKAKVAELTIMEPTGSRRLKAVAKRSPGIITAA